MKRLIFAPAALAMLIFASCSNEDVPTLPVDGEGTVTCPVLKNVDWDF